MGKVQLLQPVVIRFYREHIHTALSHLAEMFIGGQPRIETVVSHGSHTSTRGGGVWIADYYRESGGGLTAVGGGSLDNQASRRCRVGGRYHNLALCAGRRYCGTPAIIGDNLHGSSLWQ